jgi:hypothetical protein
LPLTEGGRPNWLSYIGTPDLESTVRQAESLGAKILKPAEGVPAVGRWVVLQDPQGAVFAILQPSQSPQPEGDAALGDFSWHELATSDAKGALDFYKRLFGWEDAGAMDMGPELGTYYMYGRQGRPLGGVYKAPAHMQMPPNWLPYVLVPDSHRAADATKKAGGQIISGPMEVPGGDWIAIGIDPQGGAFAVHSRKTPVPAIDTAAPAKSARKAKKTAKKAAARTARTTPKRAAKKSAKKSAKKAARKAGTRTARRTAKRAAPKKRAVKKTASRKRTAKKSARRSRR